MGVYIKDFKMPEGGYRTIEIAYDADGYPMAIADGGDVFDVIPVPPHGRLVDALWVRDQIIKQWMDYSDDSHMYKRGMEDAYEVIRNAPTIIPAEEDAGIWKEFMQNWHEEDSE